MKNRLGILTNDCLNENIINRRFYIKSIEMALNMQNENALML